jgi:hypothetical protein
MNKVTIKEETVTPEDAKKLGVDPAKAAVQSAVAATQAANNAEDDADEKLASPEGGSFPPWVKIPPGLIYPPGRRIVALNFLAKWTDTPKKGDRQCILWPLSENDERLAYQRTRGESAMAMNELAKQMVRAIDGHIITWGDGQPSDITVWWTEIGAQCRMLVKNAYTKMHTLEAKDLVTFFTECQAVRSAL